MQALQAIGSQSSIIGFSYFNSLFDGIRTSIQAPCSRLSMQCRLRSVHTVQTKIRPRGYKTFFVLNSVEHEILNDHKYKNIKKFGLFKAQLSLECYFSR